jgi:alpha-glucosidase (family GH31 glycosyl hydrolase)
MNPDVKQNDTNLNWQVVAPGVWRAVAGEDNYVSLLGTIGVPPRTEALAGLGAAELPFSKDEIGWKRARGNLLLALPLDETEKLYGLGLNFDTLNQRENVRELKVDHYGLYDNGHTHAPVPFYVSDRGYGVFVNVAERIKVYAGTTHPTALPHPPIYDRVTDPRWRGVSVSRRVEMLVPGAGAEVIVFAGPTMLSAVQRFNLFCGGGCLPPRWGLGFWHRVPMSFNAADTEAEARAFTERDFPLDVIGLEPSWHTAAYPTTYEFSPARFPDPRAFVDTMKRQGIRINLWENCMIHPDCRLGKQIRPHSGDYYAGWGGLIADLALPAACEALAAQHDREHVAIGVSGYKLDECDGLDPWLWPDHAEFPSGLSAVQLRQMYGVLFQKLTTEIFRKRGRRTYGQVRASNAGGVSFPYVIYNDCYEHRQYITGVINGGFCGVLFTPEVRGAHSPEEWLRRVQAVCMSPLAQLNAWANRVLPWSFPEVADAVRDVMKLRVQLIPYLYSAFARYRHEGVPPFRALALDGCLPKTEEAYVQGKTDDTANPYARALCRDIRDQYLMGDSIMVAPLFAGEQQRDVVIPRGRWYDFYTGQFVGEDTVIAVSGKHRDIPMFVRDGGIVPLLTEARNQAPAPGATMPLEIRHYGEAEGAFQLYDDDGDSMAYEQNDCCWLPLAVKRGAQGKLAGSTGPASGRYHSTYRIDQWRFMPGRP